MLLSQAVIGSFGSGMRPRSDYISKNASPHSRCQLARDNLVHVAPHPGFTRFSGADQRMLRGAKVLGGVLVFRGIATTHVSTLQAEPQVDPSVAGFYALLAYVLVGSRNFDLIQVRAFCFCGHW